MITEFNSLAQKIFSTYEAGDYSTAYSLAKTIEISFPEAADRTTFWQACLLTRLGKFEQAIQTLEVAVNAGHWWSRAMLEEDEDLAPLKDLPAFQNLVRLCNQKHTVAQAKSRPELLIIPPQGHVPVYLPLMLCLHGRWSSAAEEKAFWEPAAGLGWLVALPKSSQIAGQEKYSWDDQDLARREIQEHINKLIADFQVDRGKIVLAGFSQGGALAIQLAVAGNMQAAGFLVVAPGLREVKQLKQSIQKAQASGVRGYMIAGDRDPRFDQMDMLHQYLNQYGVKCTIETPPEMGHTYPTNFQSSLSAGLQFITTMHV
jgi:predicted esterase